MRHIARRRLAARNRDDDMHARTWRGGALLVAAVAALILAGHSLAANLSALVARVQSAGPWGAVLFIGGYALATTAFVPAALLTITAGALFGVYLGTLCAFAGATLAACASFILARYAARGP